MTTVVLVAIGSAVGTMGLVVALRPGSPTLRAALAELERLPVAVGQSTNGRAQPSRLRVDLYLAGQLSSLVEEQEYVRSRLAPYLAITGGSVRELCGEVIVCSSVGLVLPGTWWLVASVGGAHVPAVVPVWTALLLGGAGALVPVFVLRTNAGRARLAARKAVGSFLNLVVLCLAGGMGIESALHASAAIGQDQVSGQMYSALVLAQDSGETPWDALDRLGRELGLNELTELAAAVGLAGTEGARIRATLAAKAGSIRRHNLASAESEANAVTERLFLPGVFLLVGFLAFVAYPAVARISAGL